jgi:hypothetical protein
VAWETRNPAAAAARNLRSSDPSKRFDAIQEVQVHSMTNPGDGIPALIGALEDTDEKNRVAAARALGFVGSYSLRSNSNATVIEEAANALRGLMKDPAPAVRVESARSLGILGGVGFAVPRRGPEAARTKSPIGSPVDDRMLVEVFSELARESDAGARQLAWQGLGTVGPKLGIDLPEPLLAGLKTESPSNRAAAVKALSGFGPKASSAVPTLTKWLNETSQTAERSSEAESIARALGKIAPGTAAADEAVTGLTQALASPAPSTRVAAVKAIQQLVAASTLTALPMLRALKDDPDPKVREAAGSALKSLEAAPKAK